MKMRFASAIVAAALAVHGSTGAVPKSFSTGERFSNIELLEANGRHVSETAVDVEFDADHMRIIPRRRTAAAKEFRYADIRSAEYSYTNNPRWKSGLGLGAASILFPPLIFVALPLGFSKHRRHWVTIRTESDFAVLKISKRTRKLFVPAFETNTGVKIIPVGDNK